MKNSRNGAKRWRKSEPRTANRIPVFPDANSGNRKWGQCAVSIFLPFEQNEPSSQDREDGDGDDPEATREFASADIFPRRAFGLPPTSYAPCIRLGSCELTIKLIPFPEKSEPASNAGKSGNEGGDDPETMCFLSQRNTADIHTQQTGNDVDGQCQNRHHGQQINAAVGLFGCVRGDFFLQ